METINFGEWALLFLFIIATAMVVGGALVYVVEKWKRDR